MVNQGCISGKVDDSTYSSPMPVIGLYIAGASLACLLMMVYDVTLHGLRARKRWLPCKIFKLDSVTLTLLAVAAKLPVDLTSSMPRQEDQLSKLTGTAFLCIVMGFLVPSLGVTDGSVCFTNMLALSIFVITVVVNICIQLHTRVIVLFFVEHIIIVVLMLLLLLTMWQISFYIKSRNRITNDECNNLIRKGNESMFERLKLAHLYAYCSNPQFKISMHPMNVVASIICLICSVVVAQATFRSLILKQLHFCEGKSDYKWSILVIVIIQLLVVAIGTLAIVFRGLALFSRMKIESMFVYFEDDDNVIQWKWIILQNLHKFFTSVNFVLQLVIVSLAVLVRKCLQDDRLEFFKDLPHVGVIAAGEYIVKKSVDDIISLRDVCNAEPLKYLQLLSEKNLSHRLHGNEVCSLSLAFLVKIAQVSIPEKDHKSLLLAHNEAIEIIHFIDKTIQPKSSVNNKKYSYVKAVMTGAQFTCLVPYVGQPPGGVATVAELKKAFGSGKTLGPHNIIVSQLGEVVNLINHERCSTNEDLYRSIEQLFVDMLHALLAQLPVAIFKDLRECPDEEFEDRVRSAMKILFKIGCLEGTIEWNFPAELGVSSFIADEPRQFKDLLKRLEEVVPRDFKGVLMKHQHPAGRC